MYWTVWGVGGHDVSMKTYGFIGLGAMGAPMAAQLAEHCAEHGDRLQVWNRSPGSEAAVVAKGATVSHDPAELVAACDVVVVMLPDLPQLIELTDGPSQLLSGVRTPTVLAICSSISPPAARSYAEHAANLTGGLVEVIDAPVSGGPEGASEGTLAIMIGGPAAAVAAAWPALTSMGSTVRHLGKIGSGSLAKACNQMVVAATIIALSEASAVAESAGVDVPGLLDVLAGGYAASRVLEVKTHNLTTRTYSPGGRAAYMVKDLGFAHAEAQRTGTTVEQAELSLATFTAAADVGLGAADISVVDHLIRR
ncbi:NAD(P)-dependent oxidoreductase [Rhodococcus opacus]|uniref:NAD(P)-dependent oxidoreductase n=1 Tax=Rhodococcus opacus TaxID=37919 RepID=UPI0034D24AD6